MNPAREHRQHPDAWRERMFPSAEIQAYFQEIL
jgi:hypothetical protein